MQTAVIIDIVLALVLLGFAAVGWRRGAVKSVVGIVVIIAALIGAGIVAEQGAPLAAKALTPVISQQIETRFSGVMEPAVDGDGIDREDVFAAAGLYQNTAEHLKEDILAQIEETGQTFLVAMAEQLALYVSRAALFLAAFVVLLIALKILSKFLGLLTAVPGIHLADALGGAALGLLQGCLVLFAFIWAAQFFGGGIREEWVEQTYILRFFAGVNPVQMLFGA